jgi:polyamine oxidase
MALTASKAKKYNIANHVSNFSSLMTYNETGQVDFLDKLVEFDTAYSSVQQSVARSSNKKGQDEDLRSALKVAGYNPDKDPQAQAIDWFRTDYEYAQSSVRTLALYTISVRTDPLRV